MSKSLPPPPPSPLPWGRGNRLPSASPGLIVSLLVLLACAENSSAQSAVRIEKPLVTVSNPPPVQMLVPGFTVRELPLDLNNINSVKYRADGKLVALAYDGTIYLLTDT